MLSLFFPNSNKAALFSRKLPVLVSDPFLFLLSFLFSFSVPSVGLSPFPFPCLSLGYSFLLFYCVSVDLFQFAVAPKNRWVDVLTKVLPDEQTHETFNYALQDSCAYEVVTIHHPSAHLRVSGSVRPKTFFLDQVEETYVTNMPCI